MTNERYQSNVSYNLVDVHFMEMEWEKSFRWNNYGPLLADTFPAACVIACIYVVLVFAGQRYMRNREGNTIG